MGQMFEKTFLQRRYSNGQQTHAKRLNIISYQENANKTTARHFTNTRMTVVKQTKRKNNPLDVEKLEPLDIARNVKYYSPCGKQTGGSSKRYTETRQVIWRSHAWVYISEWETRVHTLT